MPSTVGLALGGKAAELASLALLVTLVPRVLGPSVYGLFALALAIVTFGSMALSLGGPTVLSRFVPAAQAGEREAVARALTIRLAWGRGLQLVAVAAGAAALAAIAPHRFPPLLTGLVVLALALDGAATLSLQAGLGLGRIALWSFRYPLQNAVTIAAVLALFELAGRTGAVAALAVAAGCVLAFGVAAVGGTLLRAAPRVPLPPGALRFGALQAAGGVLGQVVHRGGVVAVALLGAGSVEQGYAAVAIGVGIAATYVVSQVFVVQLPSLAGRWESDPLGAEAAARRAARIALAASIPVALVGVLLLRPGLPLALGGGFRDAEDAFVPALALLPLAPLTALAAQAAALSLRPVARLYTMAAGVAAFVVVAAFGVPAWGAAGATAALLAGTVATAIASAVAFPRLVSPSLLAASLGAAATVVLVGIAL
jgi:O-antigen/teichoic acid export membrane protein